MAGAIPERFRVRSRPRSREQPPCLRGTSGRLLWALIPQRVQAEGLCLLGGKDEGHLGGLLAPLAAPRDARAAVRAGHELALHLRLGFRGATVGAGEGLPSHAAGQSYPGACALLLALASSSPEGALPGGPLVVPLLIPFRGSRHVRRGRTLGTERGRHRPVRPAQQQHVRAVLEPVARGGTACPPGTRPSPSDSAPPLLLRAGSPSRHETGHRGNVKLARSRLRHWLAPSLGRPSHRDGVPSPYPWSSLVSGRPVPVLAPPQTWYSEPP